MIKLQDFAAQHKVTDRQVQRLLKKYETELTGLYQRKGPNGTWLTEEACEILRSKMKQQPIVLGDAKTIADLDEAKKKYEQLLERHTALAERHALLSEWKAEKAKEIADAEQTLLRLTAAEKEKTLLEGFLADAKAEIAVLSDEKGRAEGKVLEAEESAQKAQDELAAAQAELSEKDKKIQELENRNLWDYLAASFRKKEKQA